MKKIMMVVLAMVMLVMVGCGAEQKTGDMYSQRMEQFSKHPAQPNVPMMIGDSITQLWGNKATWPAGWTNRGILGDTTSGVLKRLDAHLAEHPSEIVLLIGANNFNKTVDEYISDMDKIMQHVHTANVPLTVISLLPRQVVEYDKTMSEFNAALKPLCDQYNVRYVDIHDDFTDGHGAYNSALFMDTVHPNEAGYELMHKLFVERYVIEGVSK